MSATMRAPLFTSQSTEVTSQPIASKARPIEPVPPEERREDKHHCWLCNARLRCHRREWTRPRWGRTVTHAARNLSSRPAELAYVRPRPPNDSYSTVSLEVDETGKYTRAVFRKKVDMPATLLDMDIYSCPCGCDDHDGELRALLAAHEHTGPRGAPDYRRC